MHFSYTIFLIVITVIVSLYAYEKRDLFDKLVFRPYDVVRSPREYYRVLSHAFIHVDFLHLLFNMMVLYMFGELAEKIFVSWYLQKGLYYFVLLYFGGALFGCLPGMIKHRNNPNYSSAGASGATSAVVFAIIGLFPTEGGMGFLFIPVYLPPIVFGIVYLLMEYFLSKRGGTNIGHDAHIYGALYGFAFVMLIDTDNFKHFVDAIRHWA